jgi:hypothetical protein
MIKKEENDTILGKIQSLEKYNPLFHFNITIMYKIESFFK